MSASVLVVEDDPALRLALCDTLDLAGFQCHAAGNGHEALDRFDERAMDLVISDVRMDGLDGIGLLDSLRGKRPEVPVLLMTAYGTVQQAVEAMRRGAADYLIKPFEAEVLVSKVASYLGREGAGAADEPVAHDPRSRELLALARRVAATDVAVMLTGESGVGKEVMARYVHRHSARARAPFVAVNCAAIPESMLEAILFGYEKGAFTGAFKACPGKFEQAQGGVLLLDEISEMDLALQVKLLRVLQEREVERLGARAPLPLDLRVIATSNRALPEEVAAGRFREDLYYRLNVFPLHVVALRERRGDIVALAAHLAGRAAAAAGRVSPEIGEDACARLRAHDWPGNVRELDNVIQRALVLEPGPRLGADSICIQAPAPVLGGAASAAAGSGLHGGLAARERRLIIDALDAEGGSRKLAAERLGISQRTLRYKLARLREAGVAVPVPGFGGAVAAVHEEARA